MTKSKSVATETATVKHNKPQCTEAIAGEIKSYVGSERRTGKVKESLGDTLITAGWMSTDCFAPANPLSSATKDQYTWFVSAILSGFLASEQKLANAASSSGMTDTQKATRRAVKQRVGAYAGNIRAVLKRRETIAQGSNGASGAKRSFAQIRDENYNADLKQLAANAELSDKFTDKQRREYIEHMNAAIKIMRAVAKKD